MAGGFGRMELLYDHELLRFKAQVFSQTLIIIPTINKMESAMAPMLFARNIR